MNKNEAEALVASVPHWHHKFEIFPGVITPGCYDPQFLLDMTRLPDDLKGARVLDIGVSDGFFSLQLARRGASVVAVDYRRKEDHGYHVTERLNNVDIDYRQMNVYDIPSRGLGEFDIVLFMGVLYHVPDMIRAIHAVRSVCKGTMFLETYCENDFCKDISAARYYPSDTLLGDYTSFWAPNRLCVLDMLSDVGFDVEREESWEKRFFAQTRTHRLTGIHHEKMKLAYGAFGAG
jgi:tRNA (mo5U34)-methyltransferase